MVSLDKPVSLLVCNALQDPSASMLHPLPLLALQEATGTHQVPSHKQSALLALQGTTALPLPLTPLTVQLGLIMDLLDSPSLLAVSSVLLGSTAP